METSALSPVAAYDIKADGPAAVGDPWPDPAPGDGYRWLHLDLNDPAAHLWAREKLPAIAAEALLQEETRPRCDRLGDGLILNLRGVNLNPDASPEDMVSLRMWVTDCSIISARRRRIFAVDAVRQALEDGRAPDTLSGLLVEIIVGLTDRIETVSVNLEDRTDALEDQVFDGERMKPAELADLRQAVIKMRRFINPQRDAIAQLTQIDNWIIGTDQQVLLREASNRTKRTVEELDATRERLQALQDEVEASRDQALNRHSHILSVVAAIFLPLGFLTGLFGVNVAGMPGMGDPSAFWWLAGGSLALGLVLFVVFKIADWL